MFIKFNEEAQKILKNAKVEMQKMKHAFIGSEHVILSMLNKDNNISEKLLEYGIDYTIYKKELIKKLGYGESVNNYFIYTPLLKRVLEEAIIDTKEKGLKEVNIESIFLSILDEGEGVGIRILNSLGVNIDNLYEELNTKVNHRSIKKMLISDISIDLTSKSLKGEIDPLIGRDNEVEQIIEILLRKNKNNPLLIGEAGVGKTAIVEHLASRIASGDVPDRLKNNKIYALSMASAVAGTKYRGEFEEKITKILKELEENDDIILFIDEIHTIVGAGGAEGAIDASNIIKPALARGKIKLIGATTTKEYKETICKDKALNRRFQMLQIKENSLEETMKILHDLRNIYEEYHQVNIPDNLIKDLVLLTDKYIQDKKNPDKALDILDTVCAKVSLKKDFKKQKIDCLKKELTSLNNKKKQQIIQRNFDEASQIRNDEMIIESKINKMSLMVKEKRQIVTLKDIVNVIESKTNIPIYEMKFHKFNINNLNNYLKSKIIGQEDVINNLVKITNKLMLGLKNNLPLSMLLVGKSGVGKTYLVKEYSKYLNIPLIRLDMSEYKESHTISKIIGSPPGYIGYNDTDTFIEKVKNTPFSILLLDEIEKAHQDVINLFLQVLDEGELTDSHGNKVSFRNTIIMMTSNSGLNKSDIGFKRNNNDDRRIIDDLSIPFVNRINHVLYFNDLNSDAIRKIMNSRIKELKKKYHDYGIKLSFNKEMMNDLIKKSNYEIYGARKINKIIEDKIDDIIINNLMNDKYKKIFE